MPTMPETTHPSDTRWTEESVDTLRELAVIESSAHDIALSAGGYRSAPGIRAADLNLSAPVEVAHDTMAILFGGAADFIEIHLRTGIQLEHAPGWARLVNRALDLAGIRASGSLV